MPSNIAEGAARASNAEFLQFLYAARGSLAELDTQLEIAQRRGYIAASEISGIVRLTSEVGRALQGLIARRKALAATGNAHTDAK